MKREWSEWEVVRRQVVLWGRALKGGDPAADVGICFSGAPAEFRFKSEVISRLVEEGIFEEGARLDCARSAADGEFFFIDLPDGRYELQIQAPDAAEPERRPVRVKRGKDGTAALERVDFSL